MKAAFILSTVGGVFFLTAFAQQPVLQLTATSANVSEPGNGVRIDVTRWSTDQERDQLLAAMNPPAPAPAAATPARAATPAKELEAHDTGTRRSWGRARGSWRTWGTWGNAGRRRSIRSFP